MPQVPFGIMYLHILARLLGIEVQPLRAWKSVGICRVIGSGASMYKLLKLGIELLWLMCIEHVISVVIIVA